MLSPFRRYFDAAEHWIRTQQFEPEKLPPEAESNYVVARSNRGFMVVPRRPGDRPAGRHDGSDVCLMLSKLRKRRFDVIRGHDEALEHLVGQQPAAPGQPDPITIAFQQLKLFAL
jgi:hypothetical protein